MQQHLWPNIPVILDLSVDGLENMDRQHYTKMSGQNSNELIEQTAAAGKARTSGVPQSETQTKSVHYLFKVDDRADERPTDSAIVYLDPRDMCRTPVQLPEHPCLPEEVSRNLDILKTFSSGKLVLLRPVRIPSYDDETPDIYLEAGPISEDLQLMIKQRQLRGAKPQMSLPEEVSRNLDILKTFVKGELVFRRPIAVPSYECVYVDEEIELADGELGTTEPESALQPAPGSNHACQTQSQRQQHIYRPLQESRNSDLLKTFSSGDPVLRRKIAIDDVPEENSDCVGGIIADIQEETALACSSDVIDLQRTLVQIPRQTDRDLDILKTFAPGKLAPRGPAGKTKKIYENCSVCTRSGHSCQRGSVKANEKDALIMIEDALDAESKTIAGPRQKDLTETVRRAHAVTTKITMKEQPKHENKRTDVKTNVTGSVGHPTSPRKKPCSTCDLINLGAPTMEQKGDIHSTTSQNGNENAATQRRLCCKCEREKKFRAYIDEQLKEIVEIKMKRKYTRTNGGDKPSSVTLSDKPS